MNFYANENFPLAAVLALRARGHDVLTTRDAGNAGRGVPDAEVLAFAVAHDRVLLTLNRRDFIRLARVATHVGIVVCTVDPDSNALATHIDVAVRAVPAMAGRVVRVNRGG